MGQQVLVVHVEGGGALHGTHKICKRDGRCLSNDEVDMVGGEARDEPLCELSNAHLKHHHGVAHVLVRGLAKVTCVAFLAALAANLGSHAANLIG